MGVESGEERDEESEARVGGTGLHGASRWRTDLGHEVIDHDGADQKTGRVDRRLRMTGWGMQVYESVRMGVMVEKGGQIHHRLARISSRRVRPELLPRTCPPNQRGRLTSGYLERHPASGT